MTDELQEAEYSLNSVTSVRDSWYENVSGLVNTELLSEVNIILNGDHVTETRAKRY